jgi:hypothetical protein
MSDLRIDGRIILNYLTEMEMVVLRVLMNYE